MITRILSAIAMMLIVALPIYFGGWLLNIFLIVMSLIAGYEYVSIRNKRFNILLYVIIELFILGIIVFPKNQVGIILILLIGLFTTSILFEDITFVDVNSTFAISVLVGFAIYAVLTFYRFPYSNFHFLYVIIATFGTDTGAYFVGLKFGKHKLIERVSPKKTVEGSIGGWLFGMILSFGFAYLHNYFFGGVNSLPYYLIISAILPIVSQIGDLSFSLIKRNYKVKDFGSLIPGHGGLLDRIDSLIFSLIFLISVLGFLYR